MKSKFICKPLYLLIDHEIPLKIKGLSATNGDGRTLLTPILDYPLKYVKSSKIGQKQLKFLVRILLGKLWMRIF